MTTEMKRVPLKSIRPDPKQPRKIFDEDSLQELAQSIVENDVLVPILLRPTGKTFMIVYGERRYRASLIAQGLNKKIVDIPATIREMSDAEALDAQIIENLQRHNPHPMEEAVAFKSMLDLKQMTIEEMSNRLGKKDYYIKQRLVLNNLTEDWQKVVYKNIISITDALKIAVLPEESQTSIYDDQIDDEKIHHQGYHVTIQNWMIDKFKGDLTRASFRLDDTTLNSKMGACNTCAYNTAVGSLFPEDADNPRCTKVGCFTTKTDIHLQRELAVAKDDPTILIVSSSQNNTKSIKSLLQDKIPVMQQYKDYTHIEAPIKPVFEEYKANAWEDQTLDEIQEEFDRDMKFYERDFAEYNKKISSGKYKKAFAVDGENAGKYVYVELKKKINGSAVAAADSGVNEAEIEEEINRIKSREARNKELDAEKVHAAVKQMLQDHKPFIEKESLLILPEMIGLACLLYRTTGFNARGYLEKALNIQGHDYNRMQLYKKLTNKGKDAMPVIFRFLRMVIMHDLVQVSDDNPLQLGSAAAIRSIAAEYIPDLMKQVETEQTVIATNRAERVKNRIDGLRKQKKNLPPSLSSKTKKSKR